jgi:transposase
MTAAYSIDIRERVIRSWENGRSQSWIAREFGISWGSVKRYQTTGNVKPTRQKRQRRKISDEQLAELQRQVDARSEATIAQYIEEWDASHGLRVGHATLVRALQRANRPRKKDSGR